MPTTVVSLRHDTYDVYIGRAGKGQGGYFGNPYRPRDRSAQAVRECLEDYRRHFLGRVNNDPEFRRRVLELRGKRLGCFCAPPGGLTAAAPFVCHGQVIAEWLDAQAE